MLKHQIAEIYRDHTTKVIAVYSVNVDVFQSVSAAGCYASIEPISIVICQDGVSLAMNMQAQRIRLKQLCQLVPEVHQYL